MVTTNMSSKLTREAIYELRRLLIGRLQTATRGVPRSERIEGLQAFARGWQELRSIDRLDQLVLLVDQRSPLTGSSARGPGAPLPAIFIALAQVTEQRSPGSQPEASLPLSHPIPLLESWVADGGPNSKPWWVGTRQGELFPAGLATQPV
jgi:hypothetical protein